MNLALHLASVKRTNLTIYLFIYVLWAGYHLGLKFSLMSSIVAEWSRSKLYINTVDTELPKSQK